MPPRLWAGSHSDLGYNPSSPLPSDVIWGKVFSKPISSLAGCEQQYLPCGVVVKIVLNTHITSRSGGEGLERRLLPADES